MGINKLDSSNNIHSGKWTYISKKSDLNCHKYTEN